MGRGRSTDRFARACGQVFWNTQWAKWRTLPVFVRKLNSSRRRVWKDAGRSRRTRPSGESLPRDRFPGIARRIRAFKPLIESAEGRSGFDSISWRTPPGIKSRETSTKYSGHSHRGMPCRHPRSKTNPKAPERKGR